MDDVEFGMVKQQLADLIGEVKSALADLMRKDVCAGCRLARDREVADLTRRVMDLEGRTSRWWGMAFGAVGIFVAIASLVVALSAR